MGFFGGSKKTDEPGQRRPPGGGGSGSSGGGGDAKAVREAKEWLSHPMEFGRPPDACEVLGSRTLNLPGNGPTRLTLVRYSYREPKTVGRAVTGAMVWSFIGGGLEGISDDAYLLAYCGWYFVFNGTQGGSLGAEDVNEAIEVEGFQQVRASKKYLIGDSTVYIFTGKDAQGNDVVGATDGDYRMALKKTDPAAKLPFEYIYFGQVLNNG